MKIKSSVEGLKDKRMEDEAFLLKIYWKSKRNRLAQISNKLTLEVEKYPRLIAMCKHARPICLLGDNHHEVHLLLPMRLPIQLLIWPSQLMSH